MKQAALRYIVTFLMFMALFIIEKPIFILVYSSLYPGIGIGDVFSVIWHGLLIDASVSGYLTVIPALLILVMLLVRSRVTDIIARIYFIIVSLLLAAIFVGDTVLYGYWGFKLDATPPVLLRIVTVGGYGQRFDMAGDRRGYTMARCRRSVLYRVSFHILAYQGQPVI